MKKKIELAISFEEDADISLKETIKDVKTVLEDVGLTKVVVVKQK